MSEAAVDNIMNDRARVMDIEGRKHIIQSGSWKFHPHTCATVGSDMDAEAFDVWRKIYKSQQEDDLSKCVEKGSQNEVSMLAFRYVCQTRYPDAGF